MSNLLNLLNHIFLPSNTFFLWLLILKLNYPFILTCRVTYIHHLVHIQLLHTHKNIESFKSLKTLQILSNDLWILALQILLCKSLSVNHLMGSHLMTERTHNCSRGVFIRMNVGNILSRWGCILIFSKIL